MKIQKVKSLLSIGDEDIMEKVELDLHFSGFVKFNSRQEYFLDSITRISENTRDLQKMSYLILRAWYWNEIVSCVTDFCY